MGILAKRMENCPEKEIIDKKLSPIADKLKMITGNPLSFLTWIHFLCTNSELNPETLLNDLKRFILHSYGFDTEKVALISKFFLKKENPFLAREEIIDQAGISEGDYEMMIENGILVPDDLYKPRKYRLSSDLAFFKLDL